MAKLGTIQGIGFRYDQKFADIGVKSVEQFLALGATRKGRAELALKTGIPDTLILKWINHADLIRIKGIGGDYAELLEAAGVDSVPELAQRKGEMLFKTMVELNTAKKMVRKIPSEASVISWVTQAKLLEKIVTH